MIIGDFDFGEKALFLAPMEDITGPPFRMICRQMGAALCFSEFISSEGLIRDARKSLQKLFIMDDERPVALQIFGHDVESVRTAAIMAMEASPDIIDLNFGCPVNKVVSKGAGAALLKDLPKMAKITDAVVKAVNVPVTAKTRLGWDKSELNIMEAALRLQDCGIAAITIHGRTRCMMYSGEADWHTIGEVKQNPKLFIPVIGNGDVDSPQKALMCFEKYGVDAVMIGRAAIGNPWIFKNINMFFSSGEIPELPDISERASVCLKHLEAEMQWKGEKRGLTEMRKHYSGYFKGLPLSKQLRSVLVRIDDAAYLRELLNSIIEEGNLPDQINL